MAHASNFLYSINSYLAYLINEKYYEGNHFVWCAPQFDTKNNPPSANPKDLFSRLIQDVKGEDGHSQLITRNKIGLLKGAENRRKQGLITPHKENEIIYIVNAALIPYFRPIIYIIDRNKVEGRIESITTTQRAGILSEEYKIDRPHTTEFDIIDSSTLYS